MRRDSPVELENAILRNLLAQTTSAYEQQVAALSREKELAQVTLASIGDGVITTDPAGRVRYLNPVAEMLTGWPRARAVGRAVGEVFRLREEGGEAPVDPGISAVLHGEEYHGPEGRTVLVRSDGERFAVEHRAAPIRSGDGSSIGVVIVFQDVSDRRLLSLQLAHQATHDALTGLLNREAFDESLREALEASRETGETQCLLYLDLDQFKLVNDTCGHLAGDDLLSRVATLVSAEVREGDVVARLGGDEFSVLLRRCKLESALATAERIHRAITQHRFSWRDRRFAVGASIGIVPIDDQSKTVTQVLSAADHACYVAKERGRGQIQVYKPDDVELARRADEMSWILRIQQTLDEGRFRLFGQRIHSLGSGGSCGSGNGGELFFEVLLRMVDVDERLLAPASLVRAAERYGVMREIDRWVLKRVLETLEQAGAWLSDHPVTCAVNLSGVTLSDPTFLGYATERLAAHGVPPETLCFEVTETAAIANLALAQRLIRKLSELGCRFALDDFGSGMSSYSKLKGLPVQFLKIDHTFIRDLANNPLDRAMVESIHQMAHVLGIETIAEGVSSEPLLERLRQIGVDYAQGFWLDQPGPLETLMGRP